VLSSVFRGNLSLDVQEQMSPLIKSRKPLALSNWKMAMTISESLAFVRDFQELMGEALKRVDVVMCPPFTGLWALAGVLRDSPMQLGAQNVSASEADARTGEVSAALLADVGCQWVMLGHWEVRRHLGDNDEAVNRKVHICLSTGLWPILLVGESRSEPNSEKALRDQLSRVLAGCEAEQVARMAFVYEPEGAIGADQPAGADKVAAGCRLIRGLLEARWGQDVSEQVRIIYGGSVSPQNAARLLAHPDLDGLGASRKGRGARNFAGIVQQIDRVKNG
jgi:triosephosphate isomerase